MNCRPGVYRGHEARDHPWSNWVGSVNRIIPRYLEPSSLDDLVEAVAQATEQGLEVHALGSGWAYEDLATSKDCVISLSRLSSELRYVIDAALTEDWRRRHDDPAGSERLFHVEAGVEIAKLCEMLEAQGLDVPTLGGANGQTLAGAVSTSTHGGDIALPPLPDLVRAIHLVTVGGEEVWLERASDPVTTDRRLRRVLPCDHTRIVRDDDVFDAAVVSAGRFGVIYAVVMQVTTEFRLAEWSTRQDRAQILVALETGVKADRGLAPLLETLPSPPGALNADVSGGAHFLQILFNSQDTSEGIITRRWPTSLGSPDLNLNQGESILCGKGMANAVLLGAAQALRLAAPTLALVPFIGLYWSARALVEARALENLAVHEEVTGGEALALSMNALWAVNLGVAVPPLARMAINGQFAASEKEGLRGPSDRIMTGSREVNQSDCYRGESAELIFPADRVEYIAFLRIALSAATAFNQVGYISVRYSGPSRARLSMHHFPAPQVVSIEIASIKGLEGNRSWLDFVEKVAVAHGGRPHWGQIHHVAAPEVQRLYAGDLIRWREALTTVSGASMTFSNNFTRMRGLEPSDDWSSVGHVDDVAVAALPDGRLELWASAGDGGLHSTWMTAPQPDSAWARWVDFLEEVGDLPFKQRHTPPTDEAPLLAVATLSDGRLQLWAGSTWTPGNIFTTWKVSAQPNAAWVSWTQFLPETAHVPHGLESPAVARLPDGRLELWKATANGEVHTTWMTGTAHNANWVPWSDFLAEVGPLPSGPQSLAVAPLPDGRLQLWEAPGGGWLHTTWKTSTDSNATWTPWSDFLAEVGMLPSAAQHLAVAALPDGRLELWATTRTGGLFTTWKTAADPNASWVPWSDFLAEVGNLPSAPKRLAVAALPGGRLQLWVTTEAGGLHTSRKATANPNAPWTPWVNFFAHT